MKVQLAIVCAYSSLLLFLLHQSYSVLNMAKRLLDAVNSSLVEEPSSVERHFSDVQISLEAGKSELIVRWDPLVMPPEAALGPEDFSIPLMLLLTPWAVNCSEKNTSWSNGSPSLAVVLKSRPEEYHQRMAVRHTWGAAYAGKLVFVIGKEKFADLAPSLNSAIRLEWQKYGDILLVDFIDSYYNLSLKTLVSLDWMTEVCRGPQYYLYGDTDALVYPENVQDFLRKRVGQKRSIYGKCWKGARVMRIGKWQTAHSRYASFHYPDYCAGAAIFMTSDVPKLLLSVVNRSHPYFPIDDVYFTGILAERARVRRIKTPGVYMLAELAQMGSCECMRLLATFEHPSPAKVLEAWQLYRKQVKECL